MSKAFSNLLKHIEERVFQWVKRYVEPSSTEFLLTSYIFEMTETYQSLRLSKFNV